MKLCRYILFVDVPTFDLLYYMLPCYTLLSCNLLVKKIYMHEFSCSKCYKFFAMCV
jgi:hypothetical protein